MSKTLTTAQRMAAVAPVATATVDLPEVLTIEVAEVDGRGTRSKFVGSLDEAGTVQVNIYLPEGVTFPTAGMKLEVAGKGYDRFASVPTPNRRGSVKWAFGDLRDAESFGAACFVPAKAATHTIKATLRS